MAIYSGHSLRWAFPVALAIFLSAALTSISVAQERKNPQTAGVDNTKMGPYRALAQVAYAASQKGEYTTAATLAKVLSLRTLIRPWISSLPSSWTIPLLPLIRRASRLLTTPIWRN